MRTVWKFEVPIGCPLTLTLHASAAVLHFGNQREVPTLWVLVDPEEPKALERYFRIFGTGHDIDEETLQHVGSALFADGRLVWHCFEVPS